MSDANPDVVPQESIVDGPASYEAPKPEAEEQEEPVSLDAPAEPDADEAEEAEPEADEAETEADEAEPEPEMIEFDFGGNKLSIPKGSVPEELAATLDKFTKDTWADYTRKSQANAETSRALKAKAEALEKIETLGGQALDAFTRGKQIKAELEQLSAVNLQALWQSNPDRARQLSDTLAAKQAELQGIIQAVDQYEAQLNQTREAELKRVMDEGRQMLDRKYKGFSTEIAPKLQAYVIERGISKEDAATWAANPTVTELAYKAMLYDQMQAAKKPKAAPAQAKPVAAMRPKGGGTGSSDPNKMGWSELGKVLGLK